MRSYSPNLSLKQQVAELREWVASLVERIEELEDQLGKDSRNSSKPPSSAFKKTKSLRGKSGKASGGQQGHKGKTLKMVSEPDEVIVHRPTECLTCGGELGFSNSVLIDIDKRQIVELPPLSLQVSEHQAEVRRCLGCGSLNRAGFPIDSPCKVQYGPRLKGLAQYLQLGCRNSLATCLVLLPTLTKALSRIGRSRKRHQRRRR